MISIDTLRADHLGSYGYERDTTPFLDSLAARGVRFSQAFAPSSWTLPSHMSLFTGCYPQSHGVEQHRYALPPALMTMTERLKEGGYETTAFISWTYLKASFGFGRGFDAYFELLPRTQDQDSATHSSIRAQDFVDRLEPWIEAAGDQPFFLFLHLFDPHMSYEPPLETARQFDSSLAAIEGGEYETLRPYIAGLHETHRSAGAEIVQRATVLYDGEIRFVDDQLARLFELLEARGLLEDTVVIVVSDHGEELNDHGSMEGHQWTLYDEVLHIPLIMVFPHNRFAGSTLEHLVELVDVAPTILDLAALEPLPRAEGTSLLPLISLRDLEERARWQDLAFSQLRRFNKKVAVRTLDHKLIYTEDTGTNVFGHAIRPGFELYDLRTDPKEQHNLFEADSPVARSLARQMQELIAAKQHFPTADAPELTEQEMSRLRSLGYVAGHN